MGRPVNFSEGKCLCGFRSCYKYPKLERPFPWVVWQTQMRLNLDKHLRIKISEKSFAQRFDVAMTSFSSDNNKVKTV